MKHNNNMKHNNMKIKNFVLGFVIGALIFGSSSAQAAIGVIAQFAPQTVYIDGEPYQLNAYNIGSNNYVLLRDVGQIFGFDVSWNGAVQIETGTSQKPTKQAGQATVEDLSLAANASVFDSVYSREAYNVIRQAVVDGKGGQTLAADKQTRQAMTVVLSHIGVAYRYQLTAKDDGYVCTVEQPAVYAEAAAAVSGLLDKLAKLPSDADKVRYINDVVCDKLTYRSDASAMPGKVFTNAGVSEGSCSSYCRNFKFLCDLAGLPCILIASQTHSWNMVYVDGAWLHVDCVSNDTGDELSSREALLLTTEVSSRLHIDADPKGTAFAQELLVPGSTK